MPVTLRTLPIRLGLIAALVVAPSNGQNFGQELVRAANDPAKAARVQELVETEPEQAAAVVRDLLRGAARAKDTSQPLLWADRIIAALKQPPLQTQLLGSIQRFRARNEAQRQAAIAFEQSIQHSVAALADNDLATAHQAVALAQSHGQQLAEPYLDARALSLRGIVHGRLKRWQEAIADLTRSAQAVAELQAPNDHRGDLHELARIHESAATFFSARGRYQEALTHIESARTVWQRLDDQPQLGRCLIMLGSSYGELARFADADAALQAASAIFDQPGAARGRVLTAMGLSQLDQGRSASATLQQAREQCRAANDEIGEAEACRHLGRSLLMQSQPQLADEAYARALELPGSRLAHALASTGRGNAAVALGDDAGATRHFEQAMQLGQDLAEGCWRAEAGLGAAAERAGDRGAALAAYRRAIAHLESLRRMLRLPVLRARTLTERRQPYAAAARLCARIGKVEAAFELLELLHARSLWEAGAGSSTTREPSQELQRIERDLAAIETAIENANSERSDALRTQRASLRTEHAAERIRAQLQTPRYETLSSGAPVDLKTIQSELQDREALLSYLVDQQDVWCLVIQRESARAVLLPASDAPLAKQVDALLAPIRALASGETDTSNLHFPARTAAALHARLIAPLQLKDASRLLIIADGPLHRVPFAMLVTRRERRAIDPKVAYAQYHGCRYLIEDHEIARLPAAALLQVPAKRSPEAPSLVVGHALPGSRKEARRVAKVLGMPPGNDQDPKEALVQQRLLACGTVHFATHAELDAARPAFARLQLGAGDGHDGWLHAFEIANLKLTNAPLVVLSGCNTAGHAGSSDGLLGLTRAFLAAGASAVVATHWPVADEASAALMADFHRNEGDAIAALASVQRAMLEQGRRQPSAWSHPYFWSGYAVYGAR